MCRRRGNERKIFTRASGNHGRAARHAADAGSEPSRPRRPLGERARVAPRHAVTAATQHNERTPRGERSLLAARCSPRPPQPKHAAPRCRSLCCAPWSCSCWYDPRRPRPPPPRDPRYSSPPPPRAHPVPVGPGSLLSAPPLLQLRRSPRSRYVLLLVGFTGCFCCSQRTGYLARHLFAVMLGSVAINRLLDPLALLPPVLLVMEILPAAWSVFPVSVAAPGICVLVMPSHQRPAPLDNQLTSLSVHMNLRIFHNHLALLLGTSKSRVTWCLGES